MALILFLLLTRAQSAPEDGPSEHHHLLGVDYDLFRVGVKDKRRLSKGERRSSCIFADIVLLLAAYSCTMGKDSRWSCALSRDGCSEWKWARRTAYSRFELCHTKEFSAHYGLPGGGSMMVRRKKTSAMWNKVRCGGGSYIVVFFGDVVA